MLQDFICGGVGQGWERIPVLQFWDGGGANVAKVVSLVVQGLQYVFVAKNWAYIFKICLTSFVS